VTTHPGSTLEVLVASLRLGLTSFGGPIAHIGYFRREFVERLGWLGEAEFADLVALCQSLPGPASSQLVIAVGSRRAGLAGAVAGWVGFTLPSAVLMLAFGLFAAGTDLSGAGWVHGLKVAAVAVVAQAVMAMARSLAPDWPRRILALAAMAVALMWVTPFAQLALIAAGAAAGLLLLRRLDDAVPVAARPATSWRSGALALGLFAALLVLLPLARAAGGQAAALGDAFYGSGALVFGGGHVVLPLLHASVVGPGWVSDSVFVAGYGAAQAVPGPLFTFAAYLGAVSGVAPNGVPGGLIALVAIFLPGFLLVLGVMPAWDRLRASPRFRWALLGINAAVVGILAAALYSPVWTTAITGPVDVVVAAAGLGLLMTRRVSPILIVALAAAAGQAGVALGVMA
jgi:chromate transporter